MNTEGSKKLMWSYKFVKYTNDSLSIHVFLLFSSIKIVFKCDIILGKKSFYGVKFEGCDMSKILKAQNLNLFKNLI